MIGYLNINSLPKRFCQLKLIIEKNMYILVITETEVDSSIPSSQLKIEGVAILHRCDESTIGAIKVPEVL